MAATTTDIVLNKRMKRGPIQWIGPFSLPGISCQLVIELEQLCQLQVGSALHILVLRRSVMLLEAF